MARVFGVMPPFLCLSLALTSKTFIGKPFNNFDIFIHWRLIPRDCLGTANHQTTPRLKILSPSGYKCMHNKGLIGAGLPKQHCSLFPVLTIMLAILTFARFFLQHRFLILSKYHRCLA